MRLTRYSACGMMSFLRKNTVRHFTVITFQDFNFEGCPFVFRFEASRDLFQFFKGGFLFFAEFDFLQTVTTRVFASRIGKRCFCTLNLFPNESSWSVI